jgi:2-phosphoglycerate kinase
MSGLRVVLIGGTSHAGKSTTAREVADRLGFDCRSTDQLARHPGRPWRTPEREVPPHVAAHYRGLTVEELLASVREHYERLWPRIEQLITEYVDGSAAGLVLEGSALWPARVAQLTELTRLAAPHIAAVWLTADDDLLRARIRAGGCYRRATDEERYLMDQFTARTLRFQAVMLADVTELGLDRIDLGGGRPVAEVADEVLRLARLGRPHG